MGALNLGGEEAGKERKAGAGTVDAGEKISAFYARKQRADGGCAFMDVLQLPPHGRVREGRQEEGKEGRSSRREVKQPGRGHSGGMFQRIER